MAMWIQLHIYSRIEITKYFYCSGFEPHCSFVNVAVVHYNG